MAVARGGRTSWRSLVAVVTCAAFMTASMPSAPSFAQGAYAPWGNVFAAYPGGGPGLQEGIRNLVLSDPTLAPEIVQYIKTANLTDAQRAAAEQGLAEALNQLLLRGQDAGGNAINPTTLLLLGLLAAGAGVGIYYATKKDDPAPLVIPKPVVSPN